MANLALIAPQGKFKVIAWVEDLDCISPTPDFPREVGIRDTVEEAKELARKEDHVFARTAVYDDQGKNLGR